MNSSRHTDKSRNDMKVLVATEKPFAAVAVEGIRKVMDEAGYELLLLENIRARSSFLRLWPMWML